MMVKRDFDLQMFATTVPANLVQKAWGRDTWKAAMENCYFQKFIGKDSNSIVQLRTELNKQKGDKIYIPLMLKLDKAPITGDNKLEGQEQDLEYVDFGVTINQYRWGVLSPGRMEEQKASLNMKTDAKNGLATQAGEWLDKQIFDALTKTPSANRVIYAGTKTSENQLTVSDVFNTELIGKAKRKAQFANPLIRPIKIDGGEYYVMVVDPFMARDLKKDEKWINAQKDANIRGKDNPIFSGSLGMWDKVIIHEAEHCPRTKTGAGSAVVGHGLLLGSQAAVIAESTNVRWDEDVFDYGNKWGVALSKIIGVAKTQFTIKSTPTDFAVINILASSADD